MIPLTTGFTGGINQKILSGFLRNNLGNNKAHRAAERLTTLQTERDQAQKEASRAREEAAGLRGQVETLKEQQQSLLATLKGRGER